MTVVAALLADVEAARRRTLDAVTDVSTAQGGFKPAPAEWSIAECLEHLCLAEQGGVNGMWRAIEALRAGEAPPPPDHAIRGLSIEEIIKRFAPPNPQAPEIARPRLFGPVAYWAAALAGLGPVLAAFARTVEPLDLAAIIHPHPMLGPLDARQRFELLGAHLDVHRAQIEAVKRAPGYPHG
jgi:hypothetical protein